MRIKADLLKISTGALNIKGEKLEPEEQLARREVITEAPAKLGGGIGGATGKIVGAIPASIITEQSAGDQANAMRTLCGNCKFFKNEKWVKDLRNADSPMSPVEKRRVVNKIRAAILSSGNAAISDLSAGKDNDLDVEHALHQLGYCEALYEFFRNMGRAKDEAMTLVHPASTCPADVRTQGSPDGFYQPAGQEARKAADANYDLVLQMAQGKKS